MQLGGGSLVGALLRRYWLRALLLFVTFGLLAAVYWLKDPPLYESRSTAYISQSLDKPAGFGISANDAIQDEMAVLESASIKQFVSDKLFLTCTPEPGWQPSPLFYQFARIFAVLHLVKYPQDYAYLNCPSVTQLQMEYEAVKRHKFYVVYDGQDTYKLVEGLKTLDTQSVGQPLKTDRFTVALDGFTAGRPQRWLMRLSDPSQMLKVMGEKVSVLRVGDRSRTVGVRCMETHPQLAQRIVQAMMDWYKERDVRLRQASSSEALKYLNQQIADGEKALGTARDDMKSLLQNRSSLIASAKDPAVASGYLEQGNALTELETERAQVTALSDTLAKNGDVKGYYQSMDVPGVLETDLVGKISDTQHQIAVELETKTAEHPLVQELQQTLETQKKALGQFLNEGRRQLDRKISAARQKVGEYQSLLDLTPESSVEMERLQAEITLRITGLGELYVKQQEATLQKISDISMVNVLDSATPNPRAIRPRLGQVAVTSFIFSLVVTGVLLILIRASDPRVLAAEDLTAYFGVPVLGTLKSDGQGGTELELKRLAARSIRALQQLEGQLAFVLCFGKPSASTVAETARKLVEAAGPAAKEAAQRIVAMEGSGATGIYGAQLAGAQNLVFITTPGKRRLRELNALKEEAVAAGLDLVAFVLLER